LDFDGDDAPIRRLFIVVEDESEEDECDVVIRERCVDGFERDKEEKVGGFVEDDGTFGRCDDCLVDKASSDGDVRD